MLLFTRKRRNKYKDLCRPNNRQHGKSSHSESEDNLTWAKIRFMVVFKNKVSWTDKILKYFIFVIFYLSLPWAFFWPIPILDTPTSHPIAHWLLHTINLELREKAWYNRSRLYTFLTHILLLTSYSVYNFDFFLIKKSEKAFLLVILFKKPSFMHLNKNIRWCPAKILYFFESFKMRLANFLFIKGTLFWLGITCYFLAMRGQRFPGAARVWALDPQIPSLMPWFSL